MSQKKKGMIAFLSVISIMISAVLPAHAIDALAPATQDQGMGSAVIWLVVGGVLVVLLVILGIIQKVRHKNQNRND